MFCLGRDIDLENYMHRFGLFDLDLRGGDEDDDNVGGGSNENDDSGGGGGPNGLAGRLQSVGDVILLR